MLRQEELTFIKAEGSMELSPVLLRELRKTMAAAKKKNALAATTPNASVSALVQPGGTGGEVHTSLDSVQPNVCKKKAEELSNPDCTAEPASRSPAPGHLFENRPRGPGHQGRTSCPEQPATRFCRGSLAYATVVARVANLQMASGPHKSTANG
jgi:hypothetical protein